MSHDDESDRPDNQGGQEDHDDDPNCTAQALLTGDDDLGATMSESLRFGADLGVSPPASPNASKLASPTAPAAAVVGPKERRAATSSVSRSPRTASLLSVDEHRVGGRAVLTAVGEVDISSAADLERALETARDDGASEIWLDLAHTTYMDSNGLRALLDLHDSLRADRRDANRRLVVICPPGPVLRLLVLTGVDCELEIHPTRTAAQHGS